jgi:hypothetical protein
MSVIIFRRYGRARIVAEEGAGPGPDPDQRPPCVRELSVNSPRGDEKVLSRSPAFRLQGVIPDIAKVTSPPESVCADIE